MSAPIVYIDHSRIRAGKLDDVRRAIDRLVPFIAEREPQLLVYGFHLDEVASRMTVVAVHPDTASVERHMEVGGPAFREFAELIEMERIEVYGPASERMLEQLHAKAAMLGDGGSVVVNDRYAGFARMSVAAS